MTGYFISRANVILLIFYIYLKVSSVTDHVGVQDSGVKGADLDDDEGGGLVS